MKHTTAITLILLSMFVVTQLIGLVVIDAYSPSRTVQVSEHGTLVNKTVGGNITVPYGMEPPQTKTSLEFWAMFLQIVISFVIAIVIFFFLIRKKSSTLIRIWFTFVVFITIALAVNALLGRALPSLQYLNETALAIAVPLTFFKIFKRNIVVHNLTELLIYPGLAAVFVPILNMWTAIILLIVISIYDIYAVWKSKLMVNLAKYQIKQLKVFTGFFVPYMTNKVRGQIAKLKGKKKMKKFKVNLAILGGGDVAFPLIFAGVILNKYGMTDALITIAFTSVALLLLLTFSKKGKFYPAMPFLTAGCLVGFLISLVI